MTPQEAWEGFVGDQTPEEFLVVSRTKGALTVEEAVQAYLDESYNSLVAGVEAPPPAAELGMLLLKYIRASLPEEAMV